MKTEISETLENNFQTGENDNPHHLSFPISKGTRDLSDNYGRVLNL